MYVQRDEHHRNRPDGCVEKIFLCSGPFNLCEKISIQVVASSPNGGHGEEESEVKKCFVQSGCDLADSLESGHCSPKVEESRLYSTDLLLSRTEQSRQRYGTYSRSRRGQFQSEQESLLSHLSFHNSYSADTARFRRRLVECCFRSSRKRTPLTRPTAERHCQEFPKRHETRACRQAGLAMRRDVLDVPGALSRRSESRETQLARFSYGL